MFKVETFQDPATYFNSLNFGENEIHLAPVTALSVVLKEKAKRHNIKPPILTYDKLNELFYPQWNHPLVKIFLSSRMRHYLQQLSPYSPALIKSLDSQVEEIVDSFRFAVELGVKDFPLENNGNPTEKAVQELFNQIFKDVQIQAILKERENVDKTRLCEVVGLPRIRALYAYNFSRVNAAVMLFFHRCRKWGIPVIFRIPYYEQYPGVSHPWKELYEKVTLTSCDTWHHTGQAQINRGTNFLNYLEGINDQDSSDELELNILSYPSPINFKHFLSCENNRPRRGEMQYCAFSTDLLNKSMRDVIKPPGEEGAEDQDNLINYPIGKFFFFLYECKKQNQNIYLSYDLFVECMTSGWTEAAGVSGTQAISLLKDLEPYMEGITSIAEIKERLHKVQELKEVSGVFDSLAKDQTQRNRVKRYLCNPFSVFPYTRSDRYPVTIKQLIRITEEMERNMQQLLPEDGQEIPVKDHLKALKQLWDTIKDSGQHTQTISQRIEKAVNFSVPDDWTAVPYELRRYLLILLNLVQNIETRDDTEQEIHSLEQLAGLILETEKLHITDLSAKSMLNYVNSTDTMPLHLTHTRLREILERQYPAETHKLLCHCLYVDYTYNQNKESFLKFIVFYTLCFFTGKSLSISWINDFNEYDDASVFIKILSSLYIPQGKPKVWQIKKDQTGLTADDSNPGPVHYELTKLQDKLPTISWLDLDFCPRKFFYSSIIKSHPEYRSDFHQQLVFAGLGSLLRQQANGRQDIRSHLYPLFPQWTDALKENLIATSYYRDFRKYQQFQNISYPKAMDSIQRLRSKYAKKYKIKKAYNNDANYDQDWLKEFATQVSPDNVEATPGYHCTMCPHQLLCKEGEFAIDRNAGTS
ncbi:MAG: hypothetical protein FH756_08485 [Firmicutes bacterium]|nr:hypothetical protein [Bacillota bacterium]